MVGSLVLERHIKKEPHQVPIQLLPLGRSDHCLEVFVVLRFDERVDRILHVVVVELCLGEFAVHLWFVDSVCEFSGAIEIFEVIDQHGDGEGVVV